MAEIKCSNCDRRYSALRTRCPYCGTRRRSAGKRVSESDNSLWKLIIGLALLLILIVAVIVLVVSAVSSGGTGAQATPSPSSGSNEGISQLETTPSAEPSPSAEPTPSPSPSPEVILTVEKIVITYNGREKTDVSMKVGEKLKFSYATTPANADVKVVWSAKDEGYFSVLQTGEITALKAGTTRLVATVEGVDGVYAECIIRVRAAS